MDEELLLRLVKAFEQIAENLGDLSVIQQRRYDRDYPLRKEPREAIVSRIKTEDDLIKERQGNSDEPIKEWFGGFEDPEFIGVREKAFLEEQRKRDAGAEVESKTGQGEASTETVGGKARGTRKRTRSDTPPEER